MNLEEQKNSSSNLQSDMEIITPEIKDRILFFLVENSDVERLSQGNTKDILDELGVSFKTFNAVMNQFERFGFVSDLNLRESYSSFVLLVEAHDFKFKGGFVMREEIFEANFNKLFLEIESLKKQLDPSSLDKLSKISTIASTLLGGFTLLKK